MIIQNQVHHSVWAHLVTVPDKLHVVTEHALKIQSILVQNSYRYTTIVRFGKRIGSKKSQLENKPTSSYRRHLLSKQIITWCTSKILANITLHQARSQILHYFASVVVMDLYNEEFFCSTNDFSKAVVVVFMVDMVEYEITVSCFFQTRANTSPNLIVVSYLYLYVTSCLVWRRFWGFLYILDHSLSLVVVEALFPAVVLPGGSSPL